MRILFAVFFILTLQTFAQERHVIVSGGPALRSWEDLRVGPDQHDRWWANFIRAATMRMDELRKAYGENALIVWMVYKPGYITRGNQDGKPYVTWITGQASKRNARLIWLNSGNDFFRHMNSQPSRSIINFDFFGHSNRHCFLLDYSNEIMASSKQWIHETELRRLKASIFNRNAVCQSYGCHTGESMSAFWKQATGVTLIGARGKTDYRALTHGKLPTVSGSWIR
ncbi:MAG: hypothetical protein AAGC74_01385 [Verrucomicrobiota bacterium]